MRRPSRHGRQAPAPREERKVVTVLFADLVGSTASADQPTPRTCGHASRRTTAAFGASSSGYGGTVEKFIGDAVVGLFGAPVAHEDDPERALRAAFAIHDGIAELNATDRCSAW